MYYCYILYSLNLNKYYIGETENIDKRLELHNSNFFGGSFTSQSNDWKLYLIIPSKDRSHARKIEAFIKKMKNRNFIVRLKNDPNLLNDIVNRFL